MNPILFDDNTWQNLLPLTFTRPVAEIFIGMGCIRAKWEDNLGQCSWITQPYLSKKYPLKESDINTIINGSVIPDKGLAEIVSGLRPGQALMAGDTLIASCLDQAQLQSFLKGTYTSLHPSQYSGPLIKLNYPWDIFRFNREALCNDFVRITNGRNSCNLSPSNRISGNNLFIEAGARLEHVTLNTETGPVYIGRDSEVMEGALIRGPFFLGAHSVVKMGAKIYGATSVGSCSKVGGEINNSVVFDYTNKAHEGFLGNSVLGQWVNIGADSNNSNLKNNYKEVYAWNYLKKSFIPTGLQFCGLIMGDHTKCGINSMFNTGSVVGVCTNIFGTGFMEKFIPSFAWGGPQGFTEYRFSLAMESVERVMERKNLVFTEEDKQILEAIFSTTMEHRSLLHNAGRGNMA